MLPYIMEVWKLSAKEMEIMWHLSEAVLKLSKTKIPREFPDILLLSKIPWGAWQIPWNFPDFPWKGHFPEFSRVRGNPAT